jgi:hypothetical protein
MERLNSFGSNDFFLKSPHKCFIKSIVPLHHGHGHEKSVPTSSLEHCEASGGRGADPVGRLLIAVSCLYAGLWRRLLSAVDYP